LLLSRKLRFCKKYDFGRSSDLLRLLRLPVRFADSGRVCNKHILEFTAAGTVADFHGIPFSFLKSQSFSENQIIAANVKYFPAMMQTYLLVILNLF
jgi:hypothetical protein